MAERAEQREAERVGPHVEPAERNAGERAEFRPQRFGVANFPEIASDIAKLRQASS